MDWGMGFEMPAFAGTCFGLTVFDLWEKTAGIGKEDAFWETIQMAKKMRGLDCHD